jgi:anaphase-promoting complex subunit 4
MQVEWKSAQDLPTRFIRNVDEELRERSHCDFINAAYHLVVTGNCYTPMKEWLVDELAERVG